MEFLTIGEDHGFQVKMIADSISPDGIRICTVTARYPRFVHAELMTHRAFARNAASSRAIPFKKMVEAVENHPVIPIKWGAEQKGMQTGDDISRVSEMFCKENWLTARDHAVRLAEEMHEQGLHKSLCNRLLEPFAWITTVITATEWNNFFRLRCHEHAEIHLQKTAYMLRDLLQQSRPNVLQYGKWHVPFVTPADWVDVGHNPDYLSVEETICKVSSARCARVSYLTHEGERSIAKDLDLFGKLSEGSGFGHWSPMEHPAQCIRLVGYAPDFCGPFKGWKQFRKFFTQENLEGCTP